MSLLARLRRFSARRRKFGALTFVPSERTAKYVRPRSIPAVAPVTAGMAGSVSTRNEAKNLPAASIVTVTLDGTEGRRRDHLTPTSPIFARFSRPFSRGGNPFFEKRMDCRLSRFDRARGGAILGPFRFPVAEAKKFAHAVSRLRSADCKASVTPPPPRGGGFSLCRVGVATGQPGP